MTAALEGGECIYIYIYIYIKNKGCMFLVIYSFVTSSYTAPSDWMATCNGLEIIQQEMSIVSVVTVSVILRKILNG